MGIVSLVLGILCFGGLLGIIFGHMGLAACKRGEANNRGVALAGVIVNYSLVGLGLIFVIMAGILSAVSPTSGSSSNTYPNSGFIEPTDSPVVADSGEVDVSRTVDTSLQSAPYWYDLHVGDCVSKFWNDDGTFIAPTSLPCETSHYGEVYVIGRVSGELPVNDATFSALTSQVCEGPDFATYFGVEDYYASSLFYDVLYPDDNFWNSGNHDMVCVAVEVDESSVGSLRGSGL